LGSSGAYTNDLPFKSNPKGALPVPFPLPMPVPSGLLPVPPFPCVKGFPSGSPALPASPDCPSPPPLPLFF